MDSYVAQTQTTTTSVDPTVFVVFGIIGFAVLVLTIAGMWKMFSKAGQPGWAAIVPFYNIYVLCRVGGKPGWWLVLYLIPIVDIVISIIVAVAVARNFGKGGAFGFFMLWLLSFIGYPMLGFGSARYVGAQPQRQPAATY